MGNVQDLGTQELAEELASRMDLSDDAAARFVYEVMTRSGYEATVTTYYTSPRTPDEPSFLESIGLTEE